MSSLKDALFVGPTYAALSGERRKAFIRQWIIGGSILLIGVVVAVIILTAGGKASTALVVLLILLALQFIYALVRGETIWQLRFRELKHLKEQSEANLQELQSFMNDKESSNGKN